jgi:2-polyprenyl-3-methyl-5-hydroxy-6-metoxy-1,4-benzoquinol methylase
MTQISSNRGFFDRMVLRSRRLGFTDIFHANVQRRRALGKSFIYVFGTPHLGVFANGLYLKKALKDRQVTSVLDAGCGDGSFTFYVASHFPQARVTGVDIGEQGLHGVDSTLDVCRKIHKEVPLANLHFEELDLRELKAENAFDFVYSFDVLEHIRENRLVLENIYRALQPNGLFLFRIPNRVQRRILSSRFTQEHAMWAAIEHVGQHYEMESLLTDLKNIGYKVHSAAFTHGTWGKLSFELSEAMRYFRLPQVMQFGFIPFLKALQWIDTHSKTKDGDGLLILCGK